MAILQVRFKRIHTRILNIIITRERWGHSLGIFPLPDHIEVIDELVTLHHLTRHFVLIEENGAIPWRNDLWP